MMVFVVGSVFYTHLTLCILYIYVSEPVKEELMGKALPPGRLK